MDWANRSWEVEDDLYEPKRKISNRGSHHRPHVIGEYWSHKQNRVVGYQSLTEYLFFALLELDPSTVRYYHRPVEFYLSVQNRQILHVPDVLVFRQGSMPYLFDIEPSPKDIESEKYQLIRSYASNRKWGYQVVYPRNIPPVIERNIKFLLGHTRRRRGFTPEMSDEILMRLRFFESTTIRELANSFQHKISPLHILPMIYHLIAIGVLHVNLQVSISEESTVRVSNDEQRSQFFIGWEQVDLGN